MTVTLAGAVLLLTDSVALVGIVAVFAFALVALVVIALLFQPRREGSPEPPHAPAPPLPIRLPRAIPRAAHGRSQPVKIDVPTKQVDDVISALRGAGWSVRETGDVVATDEDEEALTTLSVDLPLAPATVGSGEEIR